MSHLKGFTGPKKCAQTPLFAPNTWKQKFEPKVFLLGPSIGLVWVLKCGAQTSFLGVVLFSYFPLSAQHPLR